MMIISPKFLSSDEFVGDMICRSLCEAVMKLPETEFSKYEPGEPDKLGKEIDKIMGFVS